MENEPVALEIGWKPYHMQQGMQLNDSDVSLGSSINWGKLMEQRGYEPISSFRLKSDLKPDAPKRKKQQGPRTTPRGDLAP